MKKNILVTGGAWYIGSHTVHYLTTQWVDAEDIFVFDNLVYGHQEFLPKWVHCVKGDLLDKNQIWKVFEENKIDAVIHFAAYTYVWESMKNPWKYFENNTLWGLNLLEAMIQNDCKKIVFSSTAAVYWTPKENPITENSNQEPINPYWESKLMFEKILEWYNKIYGLKSVRLRYFNACWAGFWIGELHDPETHLIPLVLQTASWKRQEIKIFWNDYDTKDGTCVRDYIHVLDLADAHLKALELMNNESFESDFFNLWTWIWVSVKEIIEISKKITWVDFKVTNAEKRPWDPNVLVADPTKANKILQWKAKYEIQEVIQDARNWEMSIK